MADYEAYEDSKNSEENATSQHSQEDKQPLLEADQLYSGQPLQTHVSEQQQAEPGSMYTPPDIYPPGQSMLAPEMHPDPRWPKSMPPPAQQAPQYTVPQQQEGYYAAQQANTVIVAQQPTVIVPQNVPSWIGSSALIYLSVFSMICCGLMPGLVALFLAQEARTKRNLGQIESAKSLSIATIVCNILTMTLGVGACIALGVYYGIVQSSYF